MASSRGDVHEVDNPVSGIAMTTLGDGAVANTEPGAEAGGVLLPLAAPATRRARGGSRGDIEPAKSLWQATGLQGMSPLGWLVYAAVRSEPSRVLC